MARHSSAILRGKDEFEKYHNNYKKQIANDDFLRKTTEVIKQYVLIGNHMRQEAISKNEKS